MGSSATPLADRPFLNSQHPVHRAWAEEWLRLERAMKGGVHMTSTLRRFEWETETGEAFRHRRDWATYVNFPKAFAEGITGYLMRQAPKPGRGLEFGALGAVTDETERGKRAPTRADLVYWNADGVGNDGSEWDKWWMTAAMDAMAFGHTWIMEEAPTQVGQRRSDELNGARPYLVNVRPHMVRDWHFEDGVLQYAIIRYRARRPRLVDGKFTGGEEDFTYLLVRKGFDGFGSEYVEGGFWLYDSERRIVTREGSEVRGTFDALGGEIPFHPLFWERDAGSGRLESRQVEAMPAISRPAIMELSAIAESYMNLSSAADFEVWDSARGVEYLLGVTAEAYKLAVEKMKEGSRWVPVPTTGMQANIPQIASSSLGTVPAEIFDTRLGAKQRDAAIHSAIDRAATLDASGISKEATFADTMGPKLALFASELQTTQNTAIRNLEMRFGVTRPTGSVIWPRRFDLLKAAEAVANVFEVVTNAQVKSKTLMAKGTVALVKDRLPNWDKEVYDTIEKEVGDSMDAADALAERTAELSAGGGGGAPGDGGDQGGANGGGDA